MSFKGNWYYWLWHDLLKRPEPFTYTIRRNAHNNILWWLLGFLGTGLFLGHLFW